MNMQKILVAGGLFGLGTAWGSYEHRDIPIVLAISTAMILLAWLWPDVFDKQEEKNETF